MRGRPSIQDEEKERLPLRGPVVALLLTITLIGFSVSTYWQAHEQEETLASRIASFDDLVSQAVLVHDAWFSATDEAVRVHDDASIRRYRTLATDTAAIGKRLELFADISPAVRTLVVRQRDLVTMADALIAMPSYSPTRIARHADAAAAYRTALSIIEHDDAARHALLQRHRDSRSRQLVGGLLLAIAMLARDLASRDPSHGQTASVAAGCRKAIP